MDSSEDHETRIETIRTKNEKCHRTFFPVIIFPTSVRSSKEKKSENETNEFRFDDGASKKVLNSIKNTAVLTACRRRQAKENIALDKVVRLGLVRIGQKLEGLFI